VGGIGIMNIMLVSVTERTREIGLRLAIGALEREVLLQFLIEAVVLAALGGLIGIALATGASIGLSALMNVPYQFNVGVNLLSFVFSAAIGVLFGYFPARRGGASKASEYPDHQHQPPDGPRPAHPARRQPHQQRQHRQQQCGLTGPHRVVAEHGDDAVVTR